MEFKPEVREVLLKIDFVKRAKKLTEDYFTNSDNTFEDYNNEEVIKIFNELGYKIKYNNKEKFFKITERLMQYKIQFHISLRYGYVELKEILKEAFIMYEDFKRELYKSKLMS